MPEGNNTDLESCTYCSWKGIVNGDAYCLNRNSPYWVIAFNLPNRELTQEKISMGCDYISLNGKKIPKEILEQMPDGSCLKRLPLDEIVSAN